MSATPTLVIGTAGHIDHGKSRLVWALTGTDPDRLPEEKARGMTIDLGFAYAQLPEANLSFVDVPGHERFLRNMVAGATGIDLALLVVAADDSVMPQTREHAEILALLGVERVVLVLTKLDLVDAEWAAAVEVEARELLAQLGIEPLGCVHVSAETGQGMAELKQALVGWARAPARGATPYTWFRMPIDRVFAIAGRGTVVTGTVAHGAVERDQELELWPTGRRVRVRDLEAHHAAHDAVAGRTRLAINVAGLSRDEVERGHELATPAYLEPSTVLDVQLKLLRMPGKQRRQTLRVRLHLGTTEVSAELRLADMPDADLLRDVQGQLRTAAPIVATWGQRLIVRDDAATRTLGGGAVLRPWNRRWSRGYPRHSEGLAALSSGDERARLTEVIRNAGWRSLPETLLASHAGAPDAEAARRVTRSLVDRGTVAAFDVGGGHIYVHNAHMTAAVDELAARLTRYLAENPRAAGVPRAAWVNWLPRACPLRLRPVLADWLLRSGRMALVDEHVVPAGHRGALPPDDQTLLDAAVRELDAAAFQPPAIEGLTCRNAKNARRLSELIEWAAKRGQLVRVGDGLWLTAQRWDELVARVTRAIRDRGHVTVAEIRTLLDSSRKFVVPIVERLDAQGITRRVGDARELGPKAPAT